MVGVVVLAVGATLLLGLFAKGTPSDVPGLGGPSSTPTGTVRVTPSSGPAARGVSQPVEVTLPCGVVAAVDFDRSLWVPANGRSMANVARRLVAPVDPATVTLQAEDSALLRTASGQVVLLVRSRLGSVANPAC